MSSAKILKGALTYSSTHTGVPRPVVFQFNPETISRTQTYTEEDNSVGESICFDLVFNAMQDMDEQDVDMPEDGIYSHIAALEEILAYQTTLQTNGWLDWLFRASTKPVLMFVYGERFIPVRLQRLNVKEVIHDSLLKPLHAKVVVGLRVLTEEDLRGNQQGLMILAQYRNYRRTRAAQAKVDTTIF